MRAGSGRPALLSLLALRSLRRLLRGARLCGLRCTGRLPAFRTFLLSLLPRLAPRTLRRLLGLRLCAALARRLLRLRLRSALARLLFLAPLLGPLRLARLRLRQHWGRGRGRNLRRGRTATQRQDEEGAREKRPARANPLHVRASERFGSGRAHATQSCSH